MDLWHVFCSIISPRITSPPFPLRWAWVGEPVIYCSYLQIRFNGLLFRSYLLYFDSCIHISRSMAKLILQQTHWSFACLDHVMQENSAILVWHCLESRVLDLIICKQFKWNQYVMFLFLLFCRNMYVMFAAQNSQHVMFWLSAVKCVQYLRVCLFHEKWNVFGKYFMGNHFLGKWLVFLCFVIHD